MRVLLKTPLVLVTDDDLIRVSHENPGYRFEREEDGTVIVSPTHTQGRRKKPRSCRIRDYKKRKGGNAYDSSTGFSIGPAQRVFAPDASWVSQLRIDALTLDESSGFWPISPDVVIEIKFDTDIFRDVVAKIQLFLDRGTNYAVSIDPTTRDVVQRAIAPNGLVLDFDAIIDA